MSEATVLELRAALRHVIEKRRRWRAWKDGQRLGASRFFEACGYDVDFHDDCEVGR